MSHRLSDLHPYLVSLAEKHIQACADRNVRIVITQTLRSIEEQNVLYAQGRTTPGKIVTNAKGGESLHNYGLAYDIAVLGNTGITWDDHADIDDDDIWDYLEAGEAGEKLGLTWGGRWKFRDVPHYQFTFGLTLKDLIAGKRPPTNK